MNGNLAAAFVVNASFYVLVQVTRLPLIVAGDWVAIAWPERGELWHLSYSIGMIVVALLLLLWTLLIPCGALFPQRAVHRILTATAALNLALCVGTLGTLTCMSIQGFADTPSNRASRARHEMRKQLIRQHHEMEQEMRRLQR